jgi:hypothetical protein
MGVPLGVLAVALQERRMNAKNWTRLEKLAARCADALRDPHRQSEHIWRGDMWAIIGACHDIGKARAKRQAADAVPKRINTGKTSTRV